MSANTVQTIQLISFRIGAELFAINVQQVREVLDVSPITRVPNAAAHVLGVVNVRGRAIPVVDLRMRFGLPSATTTVNTRIIVLDLLIDDELTPVGALADSVNEVIELEEDQIAPAPRMATRWHSDFIRGLCKWGDEFLILLDIDRIFSSEEAILLKPDDDLS